jgi:hypothetical protein
METVRDVFATCKETELCYSVQTLQLYFTLSLLVTKLFTLKPVLYFGTVRNILPVFRVLPYASLPHHVTKSGTQNLVYLALH